MNPKKIYKNLVKLYPEYEFEFRQRDKDQATISTYISSEEHFDDDVSLDIDVFKSKQTVFMSFLFDKINPTLETLQLINNYNANQPHSKAYIEEMSSGENYLNITYLFTSLKSNKLALYNIIGAIYDVTSDTTLEDLQPLINLTYN